MRAAKSLASLGICTDSPEPSFFYAIIGTIVSCAGQNVDNPNDVMQIIDDTIS